MSSGQKKIYRIAKVRATASKDMAQIRLIKSENEILVNEEEIKERWRLYFEKLMNKENPRIQDEMPEPNHGIT